MITKKLWKSNLASMKLVQTLDLPNIWKFENIAKIRKLCKSSKLNTGTTLFKSFDNLFQKSEIAAFGKIISLRRSFCFNSKENEAEFTQENRSNMFYPNERLVFTDGRCLIAEEDSTSSFRILFYILGIIGIFGIQLSLRKLWRFGDRRWYGVIGWTLTLLFCSYVMKEIHGLATQIMTKILLEQCGTKIQVKRYFFLYKPITINISDLARPQTVDFDLMNSGIGLIGFPIRAGNDQYILPRGINRLHPEVFAAIFNNMMIDVSGENMIDIE